MGLKALPDDIVSFALIKYKQMTKAIVTMHDMNTITYKDTAWLITP